MDALIFELYEGLERLGPGSPDMTRRALERVLERMCPETILDVGCGTGAQTLTLLENCDGHITAVDVHPPFLKMLEEQAAAKHFGHRLHTQSCPMDALPFTSDSFDLIWSEGAIYIMGFEAGLTKWRPLLKDGGMIAVSELSWLTEARPERIGNYWAQEYPAIGTSAENRQRIEKAGYTVIDTFELPKECWNQFFYASLKENLHAFRRKHAGNADAEALCSATEEEMELYQRYSDYFGYVFYIMRKT